jgi:hypothetical protein
MLLGLKGGGRRVKWAGLAKDAEWYLGERFLVTGKKLINPTRMLEDDVRAYWRCWYKSAKSGHRLTFKTIADRRSGQDSASDGKEDKEEDKEVEEGGEEKGTNLGGDEQQPDEDITPRDCRSDKDKIAFLRSLLPQSENVYHSIISLLASMEVCMHLLGATML